MDGTISFSKGLVDISSTSSYNYSSNIYTSSYVSNNTNDSSSEKLCTTCNDFIETSEFRHHFKSEWHRYNMYRKQKNLPPTTYEMFLSRKELAKEQIMMVKEKGLDHIKNKQQPNSSNSVTESSISPRVPNKSKKNHDFVYNTGMNIFSGKQFKTPMEALQNMKKYNDFYLPEYEHISNLEGLLEYLGNIVFIDKECLYCGQIFSSLYAVWHHMEAKGHQKIPYEMIKELYKFYDFSPSHSKLINSTVYSPKYDIDTENDDDWEDIGSDEEGSDDKLESHVLDVYSNYKIIPTLIDESNNLSLSNGKEAVNRSTAYVYKQYLRPLRISNGSFLVSKVHNNKLSKKDFKNQVSELRGRIKQDLRKDIKSYKLFKVRSQNIIFN